MEITYAEFCEILELSDAQAAEFASWQTKWALREGAIIAECVFMLGGWYWLWEIYNDPQARAEFEAEVSKGRGMKNEHCYECPSQLQQH